MVQSNFVDLQLSSDIEVLNHEFELFIGNLSIVVLSRTRVTKSALIIVLSTNCWSWRSVRLFPTIILSTVKSSPLVMNPSSSMS